MKRGWWVVLLGILLALAACSAGSDLPEGITVQDAWIRPSPMGVGVAAGYMTIRNGGPGDDALIGARADFASDVQVHESIVQDDIAVMRPVDAIPFPEGQAIALAPGGYHLMLMDVDEGIEFGDMVTITLIFEHAGEVPIQAEARRP